MRILVLVAFILTNLLAFTRCFRTVCFYYSIVPYTSGVGMLEPDNLDTRLCTHWVYSHAVVSGLQVKAAYDTDEGFWWSYGTYKRFLSQRHTNPSLKFLLALGRLNVAPAYLAQVLESRDTQNQFAVNLAAFIKEKKFDGVHLEWGTSGAGEISYDKNELVNLLQVIRAALNTSAESNLILAVSLPAKKDRADWGTLANDLAKSVDFITIQTLDMRTGSDKKVGLSSALFSNSEAVDDDRFLSVDSAVTYYLSLGVPAEKINVAIPTFARTFTLANEGESTIGAAALGPGQAGEHAIYGVLAYYELCRRMRFGGKVYDVPSQKGRYYVLEKEWMSYDDIFSVIQKVCYAKNKEIGGLSFYSLEVDDFIAGCGRGMHPLVTTAVNTMLDADFSQCAPVDKYEFVDVPTPPGATTTPIPDDTPKPLEKRVVCYVQNYAYFRGGKTQFLPESIDPHICTHIIYMGAVFKNYTLASQYQIEESQNWFRGLYLRLVDMRTYNPHLKIIIEIGGYSVGHWGFEHISNDNDSRAFFAAQTVRFLRERKFDGLAMDWRYVSADYRIKNRLLIQALRSAFDQEAVKTGKPRLLLSTSLPGTQDRLDMAFKGEFPDMENFVDFFNVLAYDFNGPWGSYTGFHTPLYPHSEDPEDQKMYNLDWVIKYLVSIGVPKPQINVGISAMSVAWTLRNPEYNFVHADARGGRYMTYYQVCEMLNSGGQKIHDGEVKLNYAFLDTAWVSFEDIETITEKICYALHGGFGGVIMRTLDNDDYMGDICGEGKYPLTTAAFKIMKSQDMKLCARFDFSKSTSGAYQRLRGSRLLFWSLLLLWTVAGFSLA
ncbi:hypothetical protein BsWGS_06633 [Bradybaena similaris]